MNKTEILNRFSEVAQNPYQWVKDYLISADKRSIGYFCSYIPEEILHTAGFIPVRIYGNEESSPRIDAHL